MRNHKAAATQSRPVQAGPWERLPAKRGRLSRIALAPWVAVVAAIVWTGVYLFLAAGAPTATGHCPLSDVLLLPIGAIVGIGAIAAARGTGLSARGRLPWRIMALSGAAMIAADAALLLSEPGLGVLHLQMGGAAQAAPVLVVAVALIVFRATPETEPRPRSQVLLDLMGVAVVTGLTIWSLDRDALQAAVGADQAARTIVGIGSLLGVLAISRVALRPAEAIANRGATLLVLGTAIGLVGLFASTGPGSASSAGQELARAANAIFRCTAVAACVAAAHSPGGRDLARDPRGPSLLFYAMIAIGSAQLAILILDLGTHYLVVAVSCLALTGLIVVRNFFTVREAVTADRDRRKTEAHFGWLVRNSSDFIMAVDPIGTIDYVSPSVERLLQSPARSLLGTPLTALAHPEDATGLTALIDRAMASPGRRFSGEWRVAQPDGAWLPVETVASSDDGDFGPRGVVLNTRDLQERKVLEQKLVFQAFHDPLTRLANRSLFRERVEHALDRRTVGEIAVMFIDLDNFKTINDSLGHAAGDHVLVEMAHRLRSCLRTEDTAARLGGDEFAVLLEDAEVTAAARIAERIRSTLGTAFWVLGQEVYVSASIGIAIRRDGDAAGDLLRNADVAMYTAKQKGKSRFELFEPAMHDAVVARLGLEAELRRAIERQEFVVHYQPIVRLETGAVIGAEALVRWQHPTRGLVPPLEFIPLAEETGLIVPLGSWVLRQACHQLAEWQKTRGGGEPFVMNVNLSSRQLVRDLIADEVAEAVDDSGIRASWLVLEVTETVLMADPIQAATALTHIRDLGVRVALDDFGSGYSSLSHLRRFPIDIVKIDKSFVDDVTHEGADSAIARGIIELGRAMQIHTVAEGVEGDDQAEALRALGCEFGQGYYFAKPLEPAAWGDLLGAEQGVDATAEGSDVAADTSTQSADAPRRRPNGRGPEDVKTRRRAAA
jgi:diguanylate cyclase (GGDEF)-like protein/PAS domain S-box-containing protein